MKNIHSKLFLLLLPLITFLSFNKHSKDKDNSYHGVIWADAAGYFVYQPMWFIYGNNASLFPNKIDVKTGNGFYMDTVDNKIHTKYTCGVAILETPFFLASHLLAKPLGYKNDGFSKIYCYGLYFSGIFYCTISLLLLSLFLFKHFSLNVSIIAPILLFCGTNLFYYSIDAPAMSHIYSFFLFCLIIYLTPLLISSFRFRYCLLYVLSFVLVTLIRPTNFIIAVFPFFYSIYSANDFRSRLRNFFENKKKFIAALFFSTVLLIPQFFYWTGISGKMVMDSYPNEHFIFWKSPKLLEIWFAANNGLFIFTPLAMICLIGVLLMIKKKQWLGYYLGISFLAVSYIFASWWNWWFGCSFGARSFVEYYSLFLIPLCYILQLDTKYRYVVYISIIICCFWNLNIEYYYDGCFYGGTWDFETFFKLLKS